MIRPAKFVDIPGIVLLLQEGFARSHYASGDGQIDIDETKRLLRQAMHRHGHTNGGGCFVAVAETDNAITGLILGTLSRVYGIGNRLFASDLFWIASERVHPADPVKLMKAMVEWARLAPHCIEIRCGTNASIADDPGAVGRILERIGMKQYGNLYRMET